MFKGTQVPRVERRRTTSSRCQLALMLGPRTALCDLQIQKKIRYYGLLVFQECGLFYCETFQKLPNECIFKLCLPSGLVIFME